MTIDLPVSPDIAARIRAAADRRGLTVCDFVLMAVIDQLPTDDRRMAAAEVLERSQRDAATDSEEDAAADLEVLRAMDSHRPEGQKLFPPQLRGVTW